MEHTHIYQRVKDISMMNPFAYECECGDIQETEQVDPPMVATEDEIVL